MVSRVTGETKGSEEEEEGMGAIENEVEDKKRDCERERGRCCCWF
jgi:hypothetical protein